MARGAGGVGEVVRGRRLIEGQLLFEEIRYVIEIYLAVIFAD